MNYLFICFLSIIIFLTSPIYAQNGIATYDTTAPAEFKFGEIVVQASKAQSKLREMHASVTLLSEKQVKEGGIQSLRDISSIAPNFFMPNYGSKLTAPVYIRGIGSRINSPSVGLYVDYVPAFEKAAFDFDFFDIERIEVLRGPQGTLFGRNTMGGIINVFTISPMVYQGTPLKLTLGSYGQYSATIGHYRKIGSTSAFSLSMNYVHNNGFYTNSYSGNKVDNNNSVGARLRFIKKFSDLTSIENIAGIETSRQGGYPYALFIDSIGKAEDIKYNQYSYYNRFLLSDALVLHHRAKHCELKIITAYQLLDDLQGIDQDFTIDSLFFIRQSQLQNVISQEINVASTGTGNYKWLTGAYGFFQSFDNKVNVDVYNPPANNAKYYNHHISGGALFHQSVLRNIPVKNLDFTAGLRLDFENDKLKYKHIRNKNEVSSVVDDTLYPALQSMVLLPKIALNYRIGHNNIYLVAARGYKTGGFNSTFERPEDLTFNPEHSWNYEIGTKLEWFKSKVYTEIAFFIIDWENQQIYQTVPSGRGSMLKNAGHTISKGAELTIRSTALFRTSMLLSYGYAHASFIKYEVDSVTSYDGNFLPYVPAHTFAFQASRSFQTVNSRLADEITFSLLFRSAGPIYWNEKNEHRQNFYSLLDARVSFDLKTFKLEVWAKNIINRNYEAFYFEALGNSYVQKGRPFNAGISLSLIL